MNANMKVSEQCRIAASKANQVLGMIRRNITYKDKSLIAGCFVHDDCFVMAVNDFRFTLC